MKSTALVLAHGGARDTVLRHQPHWEHLSEQVIYSTPSDDPLRDFHGHQFVWGKSSRYDANTNLRTREALRYAMSLDPEWLWFYEYDAVCFEAPPAKLRNKKSISASRFRNFDDSFKGSIYLHSPLLIGRDALPALVDAMFSLPDDAELGFGDRYFGLAVDRAGIPVIDTLAAGFSWSMNHIEPKHLGEARKAYRNGARMSHGIKCAEVLGALEGEVPLT